jgi:alpha-tubulin suppressor-like RCC1 family protein
MYAVAFALLLCGCGVLNNETEGGAELGGPELHRIALGFHFSCRFRDDQLACWGANSDGRLGNGTTMDALVPRAVMTPGPVLEVATGDTHACARIADTSRSARSQVVCWGNNRAGQLGDGTQIQRELPTPVVGLPTHVQQLAAGFDHTCALSDDGAVYCWGTLHIGEGDLAPVAPVIPPDLVPTLVPGLESDVIEIAASGADACARRSSGEVVCFGLNYGATPLTIPGLESGATALTVGGDFGCAIRDATGLCWGSNFVGQLGDGTTDSRFSAAPVAGMAGDTARISAGEGHACALRLDGQGVCWGSNLFGRLGDGTNESFRVVPTPVVDLASVREIAAGGVHSCAIGSDDDRMLCWGNGTLGALGTGGTTIERRPTPVSE